MANQTRITDATMRVRDAIYECLLKRVGETLTEEVARDRANNGAHYVMEALRQLAEESKPPPVRLPAAAFQAYAEARDIETTPAGLKAFEETAEEHAGRVIK